MCLIILNGSVLYLQYMQSGQGGLYSCFLASPSGPVWFRTLTLLFTPLVSRLALVDQFLGILANLQNLINANLWTVFTVSKMSQYFWEAVVT